MMGNSNNGTERDYGALIEQIEACRNRDFTETASKSITGFLLSVGWEDARSLVKELCRREVIPSNVLGALQTAWEERQRARNASANGSVFEQPRVPPGFFEETLDGGMCDQCGSPVTGLREKASSYPGYYWTFYKCTKCGKSSAALPKKIPLLPMGRASA